MHASYWVPANAVALHTHTCTCRARPPEPTIRVMSSAFMTLAIWLAFLYPAAQVLRLLDQAAAAIHPGFSVVGSLHDLLSLTVSAVGG